MSQSQQVSLKTKSIAAVWWSALEILVRQGLRLIVSVILARLLSPEEFGTVALLYIFADLAHSFIDGGFSSALVQRKDITHTDESTVFWFSICMAALCAAALALGSPHVARFYGIEVLGPLMLILAINILVTSLGSVHHPLLTKKLELRKITTISAVALVVSSGVAIGLAVEGYGVWSLAMQSLSESIVMVVLLWLVSGWYPRLVFSRLSARRLFGYGRYVMVSSWLDIAYNRVYSVVLGKWYGVYDLGIYNRAENTRQLPMQALAMLLARVALPIFSSASENIETLRRGLRYAIQGVMFINAPLMLGLMATSESFIELLYGPRWLPAASLLEILCLAGVLWPLQAINQNVLKAMGRADVFFRVEVLKKFIGTGLLLAGLTHGTVGLAWSQVIYSIVAFLLNAYFSGVYLNYGAIRQTMDFLPSVAASSVMAISVHELGAHLNQPILVSLTSQIAAGALVFIALCHLFKVQTYREMQTYFLQRVIHR